MMDRATCGCEHTLIKHVSDDNVEYSRPIVTSRIGKHPAKVWCRKCGWVTLTDEQVNSINAHFKPHRDSGSQET